MDYKKAFYSKLEDCYLGVDIKDSEDKSGFTNLLKIKREYFKRIKEYLDNEINGKKDEASDIYNKLYTFFDSYLNETGTPFFNKTENYKNILSRIYTNSKDTNLFYKTENLYYVKSDAIYKDLEIEYDDNNIFKFDVKDFIQNADNTKIKIFFKLNKIYQKNNKNIISIKVLNDKTLLENSQTVFKKESNEFEDKFLKILPDNKMKHNEDKLKKIFFSYKKQMEIDFFIHKDAKTFLEEQFDIWMYNYLYKGSEFQKWNIDTINKLLSIRNIALRIIDFISKFEDELKYIWLKPKFVKNTQYVFSLDIILNKAENSNELLKSILEDKNFNNQIKEWKELNFIDENFNIEKILKNQNLFDEIESKYQYLPIDTKYLSKETKYKLLSSFDNIEEILNGELIKSDNFQALNTIMPKYMEKIDLIYIDPPFNTGKDFEYKDNFQDSTWLTLIDNRLELAKYFLSNKGSFYVHLDENADYFGKILIDKHFNSFECKKITFDTNATKDEEADLFGYKSFGNNFALKSSTIFFIKTDDSIFNKLWKPNRNTSNLNLGQLDLISKLQAELNNAKKIKNLKFYIEKWHENNLILEEINLKDEKIYPIGDIWNDLYSFTQSEMRVSENISFYSSQKPENMLRRIIQASTNKNNIVLDFFAGSGTSLSAAHKLNRKWIGIEIGKHFYEKYYTYNKTEKKYEYRLGLLGRMKNVIAGDQSFYAIDKKRRSTMSKLIDYKGGGAFKYYELESYEEALKNCEYILDKDKSIDYRKSRKLIKQLDKTDKAVKLNMSDYRENFDIFTTMSNLMNLKIKKLYLHNDIETCEFDNGDIVSINDLDLKKYPKLKSLIFW